MGIAAALAAGAEGLVTKVYLDPVGIPTVCFGETRGVHLGDSYTPQQCKDMLEARMAEFDAGLAQCIDPAKVPDESWASFLSWSYNVGLGAACGSTLARKANAGDILGACDELLRWDKATLAGTKVTLPGLTKRRQDERELCREGLMHDTL